VRRPNGAEQLRQLNLGPVRPPTHGAQKAITMENTLMHPSTPLARPALLTVQGFHHALGGAVGINSLRKAVREGRIRSLRVGERKRVIPSTELADWPQRDSAGAQ
jgi:hypothetical protein